MWRLAKLHFAHIIALPTTSVKRVIFNVFKDQDLEIYEGLLGQ